MYAGQILQSSKRTAPGTPVVGKRPATSLHTTTRQLPPPPSQASPDFPPFSPKYADYAPRTVIGWLSHEEVSVATIKGREFSGQSKELSNAG